MNNLTKKQKNITTVTTTAMSALPPIEKKQKTWRQRVEEEENEEVELKQQQQPQPQQQQLPSIIKETRRRLKVEYLLPDAKYDEINTKNLLKVLNFWHACEGGEASYRELANWLHGDNNPKSSEWFTAVTDARNYRYAVLDANGNPVNPLRDDVYGNGRPSPYDNLEYAILSFGAERKKEALKKLEIDKDYTGMTAIEKRFARSMTSTEEEAHDKKANKQRERLLYFTDKEDPKRVMTNQEKYPRILRRAMFAKRGIDMSNPKKNTSGHFQEEEEEEADEAN